MKSQLKHYGLLLPLDLIKSVLRQFLKYVIKIIDAFLSSSRKSYYSGYKLREGKRVLYSYFPLWLWLKYFFCRDKYLATDTPETHVGFNVTCPFFIPRFEESRPMRKHCGKLLHPKVLTLLWTHQDERTVTTEKTKGLETKHTGKQEAPYKVNLGYKETKQYRLLTAWSQVCLWKVTLNQEVKEFPARDGEGTFSTMFTQNPEIVEWSSINWYV
jgi:hypothetical protein